MAPSMKALVFGETRQARPTDTCLPALRQLQDDPTQTGAYHFPDSPDLSWAASICGTFVPCDAHCDVIDVLRADYPAPAPRPRNLRMDNSTPRTVVDISRRDWRISSHAILTDFKGVS